MVSTLATAVVCSERSDGVALGQALELALEASVERVLVCDLGASGDGVLD